MRRHWTMRSEVCNEQRFGPPAGDRCEAGAPQIEIDVGRRCRRHDRSAGDHPDAGRVADKREPGVGAEVAHMMRRVARCVRHLEVAAGDSDPLATAQRDDRMGRHGQHVAPQAIHLVAVQPRRAGHELRRIDHVRRAPLVHVHAQRRLLLQERARRAGVIEMDVREHNRCHVGQ